MASPQAMPLAPPPEPYTSYNTYTTPSTPSTSAAAPPPRLSSHPFLVDQTPYLSRRHSGMSFVSTSSGRTARSASASSASSTSSTASSSSTSGVTVAPWQRASAPARSLAPAATIHTSTSYSRPAHASHRATASLSSTQASPPQSPSAPIDRRCLQWLREAEQQEMILGSVASRVSPRGQRRELPEASGGLEVLEEHERPPSVASTASKTRMSIRRKLKLF